MSRTNFLILLKKPDHDEVKESFKSRGRTIMKKLAAHDNDHLHFAGIR